MLLEQSVRPAVPEPAVRWLAPGDESAWDAFVARHPYGLIYDRTSWKRVLEEAFPHIRGRFLVLCDPYTGAITAGLPVYTVRSWLLGNRVVSVPYASFCDPLISTGEDLNQLLPHLLESCREASARRLEIRTRSTTSQLLTSSLAPASLYKHHVLVLDKEPDALFRTFAKSSVCQKVTKAQKAGVSVVEAEGSDSLNACYNILARTRRRLSLPPMPLSFFEAMRTWLWPEQMKMFLAWRKGRPAGCHLVLMSGKLWISEHSGNTDDAVHGTNQLLYWEAIRAAHNAGAEAFSFGRTATSNEGLLSYKRRWGPVEEDVVSFVLTPERASQALPGHDRERTWPYRIVRTILARAPMPACKAIGRFCYRHLG